MTTRNSAIAMMSFVSPDPTVDPRAPKKASTWKLKKRFPFQSMKAMRSRVASPLVQRTIFFHSNGEIPGALRRSKTDNIFVRVFVHLTPHRWAHSSNI